MYNLSSLQNQSIRAKDNCERMEDEQSKLQSRLLEEERKSKQLQSQLNRALESQEDIIKRDIEQSQTIAALVCKYMYHSSKKI